MHPAIRNIYANADDRLLQSAISETEGSFLHELVRSRSIRSSIEVGCGFGLSSAQICTALRDRPGARHLMLDPFQASTFKGAGIQLLRDAGIDFFELIEKPSEFALPGLLAARERFDFCFIDGFHTFDQTLVDFYYMNRLLKVGGIMAIDDVNHPAVNKAVKYLYTYPCYRLLGSAGRRGARRKLLNTTKALLSTVLYPVVKLCGESFGHEFLDSTLVRPRVRRDLDTCTMVAFEKMAEDDSRDTNWFQNL
jgi:predicted O-methyltransferase YrrM